MWRSVMISCYQSASGSPQPTPRLYLVIFTFYRFICHSYQGPLILFVLIYHQRQDFYSWLLLIKRNLAGEITRRWIWWRNTTGTKSDAESILFTFHSACSMPTHFQLSIFNIECFRPLLFTFPSARSSHSTLTHFQFVRWPLSIPRRQGKSGRRQQGEI